MHSMISTKRKISVVAPMKYGLSLILTKKKDKKCTRIYMRTLFFSSLSHCGFNVSSLLKLPSVLSHSVAKLADVFDSTDPQYFVSQQHDSSDKSSESNAMNFNNGNMHKLYSHIGQYRTLNDFIPLLSSLLYLNKVEDGEALLESLRIRYGIQLNKHLSTTLCNMFIRSYSELAFEPTTCSSTAGLIFEEKLQEWYQKIYLLQLIPDEQTFGLLFNYCMKMKNNAALSIYIQDAIMCYFTVDRIISTGLIEDVAGMSKLWEEVDKNTERENFLSFHHSNEGDVEKLKTLSSLLAIDDQKTHYDTKNSINAVTGPTLPDIQSHKTRSGGIEFIRESLKSLNLTNQLVRSNSQIVDNANTKMIALDRDKLSKKKYVVQEMLEQDSYTATVRRINQDFENYRKLTHLHNIAKIRYLFSKWTKDLSRVIGDHLQNLNRKASASASTVSILNECMDRKNMGKSITASSFTPTCLKNEYSIVNLVQNLSFDKIALITLLEMFRIHPTKSNHTLIQSSTKDDESIKGNATKVVVIASAIGLALEREIYIERLASDSFLKGMMWNERERLYDACLSTSTSTVSATTLFDGRKRDFFAKLATSQDSLVSSILPDWTAPIRIELGGLLMQLAVDNLMVDDVIQEHVFTHEIIHVKPTEKLGIIRVHPLVMDQMEKDSTFLAVDPTHLPMIVPPKPWLTYCSGGYLSFKNKCVRLKEDPTQIALLKENDSKGLLKNILIGLDVLGSVAWRINEPILNVMIEAWNAGLEIAGLPPKLPILPPPARDRFKCKYSNFPPNQHQSAFKSQDKERDAINAYNAIHSQRSDLNYKLEIAKSFIGRPFFFPHNIDFRGRAYPIPPHFNHLGSDICRGVLKFHDGKRLGKNGLRWMKIHLANLYGINKVSLDKREAFANEHLIDIYDSTDNPLGGNLWWTKGDDPWQCLATCMELASALRSKDPVEDFISNLPVHQDGSCNGLQHYAALGRDIDGAVQVNLVPRQTPQDVYAAVASIIEEELKIDAKSEHEGLRENALLLLGKVNRKIVKQPVMTNVYGVTGFGARKQIHERLKEYKIVNGDKDMLVSSYLSKKVFFSLDKLFVRARMLQTWLANAAKEITLSVPPEFHQKLMEKINESVNHENIPYPYTLLAWTSPLGFPAVQPYRKKSTIGVKSSLQLIRVWVPSEKVPVDVHKQVAGFPPNFIHSLDATHMFMTAIACKKAGLTFASVHDSFWTHACDVDQMNTLLRKEFVALHSSNIIKELHDEFYRRYGCHKIPIFNNKKIVGWRPLQLPPLPEQGELNIEEVNQSVYFFS